MFFDRYKWRYQAPSRSIGYCISRRLKINLNRRIRKHLLRNIRCVVSRFYWTRTISKNTNKIFFMRINLHFSKYANIFINKLIFDCLIGNKHTSISLESLVKSIYLKVKIRMEWIHLDYFFNPDFNLYSFISSAHVS